MEVVTVNRCGELIQMVWLNGALLRLDELTTVDYILSILRMPPRPPLSIKSLLSKTLANLNES